MQKEINFYQEMASEHRLQEYSKGTVPLYLVNIKNILLHFIFMGFYSTKLCAYYFFGKRPKLTLFYKHI